MAQGIEPKDIRTEAFALAPIVSEEANPRGAAGKRISIRFSRAQRIERLGQADRKSQLDRAALDRHGRE